MKNSLYGELRWEDAFDEKYWFARVENEIFGEHEVLIYVNSPTDFMTVLGTHSTYKNILADLKKSNHNRFVTLLKTKKTYDSTNQDKKTLRSRKSKKDCNYFASKFVKI